jgi:hypothetical protein
VRCRERGDVDSKRRLESVSMLKERGYVERGEMYRESGHVEREGRCIERLRYAYTISTKWFYTRYNGCFEIRMHQDTYSFHQR